MDIIKWGWENAWFQKENAKVLSERTGKQAIVVSAMRSDEFNTTSQLIHLADLLAHRPESYQDDVYEIHYQMREFHQDLLSSQWASDSILRECRVIFWELESRITSYIVDIIPTTTEYTIPTVENDYSISYKERGRIKKFSLAWFWEYISARLNTLYMQSYSWLSVWMLERLPWDNKSFYDNTWRIASQVRGILLDKDMVFIPWYLPGTGADIMTTVGRWYSDATASLIALSMKEEFPDDEVILCIEKMVEGFMSADPRIVDTSKLIPELNYILAKEIITEKWPEAKLLHPKSLDRRIQAANIPVRLYNPFSTSPGTMVTKMAENMSEGIFYIGGVKDIEALVYSSGRMEEWFIAETSQALADTWVNVKEVLGSWTEHTSLFSPSDISITDMKQTMIHRFWLTAPEAGEFVEHRDDYSLVYCVGNMKDIVGSLAQVTSCLKNNNINVKWFTQWLEQRAMAIVVDKKDYQKTILALHDELIPQE